MSDPILKPLEAFRLRCSFKQCKEVFSKSSWFAMEKRKAIKTMERSCRSGKILSACWTCDWGCMAGDIHNNTITFSYITTKYKYKIQIQIHNNYILLHSSPQNINAWEISIQHPTFIHKISTILAVSIQTDDYLMTFLFI